MGHRPSTKVHTVGTMAVCIPMHSLHVFGMARRHQRQRRLHEQSKTCRPGICTSVLAYARRGVASIACQRRRKSTSKALKDFLCACLTDGVDAISDVVLSSPYLDELFMLATYSSSK